MFYFYDCTWCVALWSPTDVGFRREICRHTPHFSSWSLGISCNASIIFRHFSSFRGFRASLWGVSGRTFRSSAHTTHMVSLSDIGTHNASYVAILWSAARTNETHKLTISLWLLVKQDHANNWYPGSETHQFSLALLLNGRYIVWYIRFYDLKFSFVSSNQFLH